MMDVSPDLQIFLPTGGIVANPFIGVPAALGAVGARAAATKLREQSVNNLADLMRLGKEAKIEAPEANIGEFLKSYEMRQ